MFSNKQLQVETFGTMEKKEKVEFILEQMRLCFETKDYIRTQIISKKISTKYFEAEDTEELKLRFDIYIFCLLVFLWLPVCVSISVRVRIYLNYFLLQILQTDD